MEKIKEFLINNKKELLFLALILLLGAFFRLYKIDEYMIFLGDEGRDMIIVRRFLVEAHPPLIGPGTSIGNMYLGPLYYYMMAIPTLIANFSPVGPAVMVAILGVVTIALVWWVGREWFGKTSGIVAAGLYAISPTIIIFSKSSWNPNIMPFFSLLSIYSIWKVYKSKNTTTVEIWMAILGISSAFVLQSHYLGLLIFPVLFIFWLFSKVPIRYTLISFGLFCILMSPLLIFDFRHNFQNFNSMKKFSVESSGSFAGPIYGVTNFMQTFYNANTRILGGRNKTAGFLLTILLIFGSIRLFKQKKINPILVAWMLIGLFGLSMYKSEVFDHYMGFIFPAFFLLLGQTTSSFPKGVKFVVLFLLIVVNLVNSPLKYSPNKQLQRSIEIASFIMQKANSERFNLATISERGNRDVYQYFLLIWGAKIVDTDPSATAYTVTDQLFVVCEKPKEMCDPVHDSSAWIANFGWSKVVDFWEFSGVNIFKLGHTK